MRKGLLFALTLLLVLFPSCTAEELPAPQPEPYLCIPIPAWVNTPQDVTTWLISLGSKYEFDKELTGYIEYYLTPAEFFLSTIPDAYVPGAYIKKPPYHGDCDDYAILTAYVMQHKLGMQANFIIIQQYGLFGMRHALSAGYDRDGRVHVFSLWNYKGSYSSVEEAVARNYYQWFVVSQTPIDALLEKLYKEGHLRCVQQSSLQQKTANPKKREKNFCTLDGGCQ